MYQIKNAGAVPHSSSIEAEWRGRYIASYKAVDSHKFWFYPLIDKSKKRREVWLWFRLGMRKCEYWKLCAFCLDN